MFVFKIAHMYEIKICQCILCFIDGSLYIWHPCSHPYHNYLNSLLHYFEIQQITYMFNGIVPLKSCLSTCILCVRSGGAFSFGLGGKSTHGRDADRSLDWDSRTKAPMHAEEGTLKLDAKGSDDIDIEDDTNRSSTTVPGTQDQVQQLRQDSRTAAFTASQLPLRPVVRGSACPSVSSMGTLLPKMYGGKAANPLTSKTENNGERSHQDKPDRSVQAASEADAQETRQVLHARWQI